jgi:hypothetical protein
MLRLIASQVSWLLRFTRNALGQRYCKDKVELKACLTEYRRKEGQQEKPPMQNPWDLLTLEYTGELQLQVHRFWTESSRWIAGTS